MTSFNRGPPAKETMVASVFRGRTEARGDLGRRGGGGGADRGGGPANPGDDLAHPGRSAPGQGLPEVRELPAGGSLQVPRGLQCHLAPLPRGAPTRGPHLLFGQPRPGDRAREPPSRHPGHDRHARGRPRGQAAGHGRLWGPGGGLRPRHRAARGSGGSAREGGRPGPHPALRSSRRDRRAGDLRQGAARGDGARTPSLGKLTFPLVRANVDDMLTVSDADLVETMRFVWERMKLVVEPTGVLGLAAAYRRKVEVAGRRVGAIVSGGNVDLLAALELFRLPPGS